jgi:CheY-like chemotaxis protein
MVPDVLIVEDDQLLRSVVAGILSQEAYSVAEACDGFAALDQLREVGTPGLMLLDLMMPRMNGWELRERMLADPAWAGVPVVVMTAHSSATNDHERLQVQGWLHKPVRYEHLLRMVGQHCWKPERAVPAVRWPS